MSNKLATRSHLLPLILGESFFYHSSLRLAVCDTSRIALTKQSKTVFNVKVRPRSIRIYCVVNNTDSGLTLHNVTKG